jgi:Uma2 family endonuclease
MPSTTDASTVPGAAPARELLASPKLALYHGAFERRLEQERADRERFYEETDASTKAEFINGEVVMSSPARVHHLDVQRRLTNLMSTYAMLHQLGKVVGEKALVSLTRNDYEPDVAFFAKEKAAGFAPDQWKLPAPDFACEILSPGTEARDRGVKREDYAAHGVGEYWIVDPAAQTVEQYVLEDAGAGEADPSRQYVLRLKVNEGEIESTTVEGFRVPVAALFDDDAQLEALRALLG